LTALRSSCAPLLTSLRSSRAPLLTTLLTLGASLLTPLRASLRSLRSLRTRRRCRLGFSVVRCYQQGAAAKLNAASPKKEKAFRRESISVSRFSVTLDLPILIVAITVAWT
jgi:hypothetical protein